MNCYVVFVKTGYEHKVANEITCIWQVGDIRPFVPTYEACFRKSGKVFLERRRLMPGYVFIESSMCGQDFYLSVVHSIKRSEYSLKLLRNGCEHWDSNFEMNSDDYVLIKKLINDSSCIEMSQGFIKRAKIVVTNGPLTGAEGLIKKINRHKMEAAIDIRFMGTVREMTVGLEIIKSVP